MAHVCAVSIDRGPCYIKICVPSLNTSACALQSLAEAVCLPVSQAVIINQNEDPELDGGRSAKLLAPSCSPQTAITLELTSYQFVITCIDDRYLANADEMELLTVD